MLRRAIFSIALFLSFKSYADVTLVCNSCSTTNSYIQTALNKAESLANNSNVGFNGNINVINPTNNKVYSWSINSKWIFQGEDEPTLNTRIYSRTPPQYLIDEVSELSQLEFFKHIQRSKRGISVPKDSGFETAYDIARNKTNHDRFDDWYHDNYPLSYWARIALDTVGQIGGSFPGASLFNGVEVKFVFSDGSTARFKVQRFQTGNLTFTYVPNSAKNKDNISIADFGSSFSGEYTFSSERSLRDFLSELGLRGIEIRIVRLGGGRIKLTEIPTVPK